jgi:molecular chaperone GrpE
MVDEREEQETREEATPQPAEAPAADEPQDVAGLRARLDEEKTKAQDYLASWQRAAADYQNLKRRMEQERSEVGRLANAALVINLLPLLDDIERALRTVDTKLAGLTWIDGVWLIYRKFQAVLENAGVKEIPAEGEAFDPKLHEAISQAPGEEGKVVSVVQKGYTLGERVVRPAMVIVGQGQGPGAKGQQDAGAETREAGGETREAGGEPQDNNTEGQASA